MPKPELGKSRKVASDEEAALECECWSAVSAQGAWIEKWEIDDHVSVNHILKVSSRKTYRRPIRVRGSITSKQGCAEFSGPGVLSGGKEWESEDTVADDPSTPTCFSEVMIVKKKAGRETVDAKVSYQDLWRFDQESWKEARLQPYGLDFEITVR